MKTTASDPSPTRFTVVLRRFEPAGTLSKSYTKHDLESSWTTPPGTGTSKIWENSRTRGGIDLRGWIRAAMPALALPLTSSNWSSCWKPISRAISNQMWANLSQSNIGYSASSAVAKEPSSFMPQGRWSCELSHHKQSWPRSLFDKNVVDLSLSPPCIHEWKPYLLTICNNAM